MLHKNDSFLLENNVNERSVTHKLAEYIQLQFQEYHVDCEYNRMPGETIERPYINKKLNLPIDSIETNDTKAKTVFPDIVVHRRGDNMMNLLVIEAKKVGVCGESFDRDKLAAYKRELGYSFAAFILFSQYKTEVDFV